MLELLLRGRVWIRLKARCFSVSGRLFLTPLLAAFHDGTFDTFDADAAASASLEALAEQGDPSGLIADAGFAGAEAGVIFSPGGFPGAPVIDPGETAQLSFDLDELNDRYFSFLSMVIPSNNLLIGNDNPLAHEIFDVAGLFTGLGIIDIFGGNVYDAGTELNNNMGAAFNTRGGTAIDEGGVVALAGDLSYLLNQPTVALGTISSVPAARELLARIEINVVPVPAALPLLLVGLGSMGFVARRRKKV